MEDDKREGKLENEKKQKDFLIDVDIDSNTVMTNLLDVLSLETVRAGDFLEFNSPGRLDKDALESFVYGFIQRAVVYEDRVTRTRPLTDPQAGGGELMLTGADLFCENFLCSSEPLELVRLAGAQTFHLGAFFVQNAGTFVARSFQFQPLRQQPVAHRALLLAERRALEG